MPTKQSDILLLEIERLLQEGKEVVFTPRGVSMRPFIEGGKDSVTLVKKPTFVVGDIVLAHIGNRYILHRIVKLTSTPLSPNSSTFTITLQGDGNLQGYEYCSEANILGTVIEIRSSNGQRKLLTKGSLWRLFFPFRKYLLKIYRHL